jgi:hypothetical protein
MYVQGLIGLVIGVALAGAVMAAVQLAFSLLRIACAQHGC